MLGGALQSRAANKSNDAMLKFQEQEFARRNMMQGLAAPSMMHALGYRNPQQIASGVAQIRGTAPAPGAQPTMAGGAPAPGSSGLSKGLGAASTGLGIASAVAPKATSGALGALGIGGIGIPILGAGLAAGAFAANKIGQGRRAANSFVDAVENPFGAQLEQISAMAATDPASAKQQFAQAYQNFQNQANSEIARGGNQAKVAQQALANPKLMQTIQQLQAQLGGVR